MLKRCEIEELAVVFSCVLSPKLWMNLQVIIVTSTLTKDMNCKNDLYRSNAIRVLCRISDAVGLFCKCFVVVATAC